MRVIALLGAVVSLVLAACALDGCYTCRDKACSNVPPGGDYPAPSPLSAPRDAGRE